MKKAEVLEEYYLEENNSEDLDLVGWKVIGNIDKSKTIYHENFTLKTTTEGWLDEFGIHVVTSSGLILVSDNCPFLLKESIIEAITEYIETDEFKLEAATYFGTLMSKTISEDDVNKWIDTTQITYPTYNPSWVYTPTITTNGIYSTNTATSSCADSIAYNCDTLTCSADDLSISTISSNALADAISASISCNTATVSSC